MAITKNIKERGKIKFSRYFQDLKEGDKVSVVIESAVRINALERIQGRTGTIKEKRGRACVVLIKDQNKMKEYILHPVHLKKVEQIK